MSMKAVDLVLLPCEEMTEKAIEANGKLVRRFGRKIVLNKKDCLPHISLAMGCLDEAELPDVEKVLKQIAGQLSLSNLTAGRIEITVNSVGEKVSSFEVERTKELQRLHEEVTGKVETYFSYDVSGDMICGTEEAAESTLLWIKNYREKSSFGNFRPHITIGYGQIDNFSLPIKFTASELALCHLGNHCTCRKVLLSIKLETA